MRKIIASLLLVLLFVPSLPISAAAYPASIQPVTAATSDRAAALPWIVPWFARTVRDWLIGEALSYGVDRVRLALAGRDAATHCANLRNSVHLSSRDRQLLVQTEGMYRTIAETLARRDFPDLEARRQIEALEREMTQHLVQIERRLNELERRIHAIEVEQRRQHRVLVDLGGRIVRLENGLYDLEGRLVQEVERVDALYAGLGSLTVSVDSLQTQMTSAGVRLDRVETEVQALGTIVRPDPNRYLRYGTYFSIYGLYADATGMDGDANIGGGLSVQANLNRWIGVFGEAAIIPIEATDGNAPDGSPLEWVTFPVMAGFALNILPPQSPISLQLSGGGGISYSSLRYYPEDYDPELGNWADVGDVASLTGIAKLEIGAAPVLSDFEPVLTIGYLGFQNPINYSNGTTSSNAGRELLYLSLGGRLRTNLPGDKTRPRR